MTDKECNEEIINTIKERRTVMRKLHRRKGNRIGRVRKIRILITASERSAEKEGSEEEGG